MPYGLEEMKHFIGLLEKNKITYVVHAGFGLDGLRGKITRPHNDLDILSLKSQEKKIRKLIEAEGFSIRESGTTLKLEKDGIKLIDIGLLKKDGRDYVSEGFVADTQFPSKLLKPQKGRIGNFEFNVASNELLRMWGSHSKNINDRRLANLLDVDEKMLSKVKKKVH